jgi:hypothetical protein
VGCCRAVEMLGCWAVGLLGSYWVALGCWVAVRELLGRYGWLLGRFGMLGSWWVAIG